MYACEERRMFEIAQSLGMAVVFVRYNPDAYRTAGGSRGAAAAETREKVLVGWVKAHMREHPAIATSSDPAGSAVYVQYLYYDGWTDHDRTKGAVQLI